MRVNSGGKTPRTVTADEAARLVKSGDWLDYASTLVQPDLFDGALAARRSELRNVKIRSCITMRPRAVLDADPRGEHFFWFSWHFSGYDRAKHDAGIGHYIPVNLGEVPDYYRRFNDPVDVAIIKTRPMDEDGWFNFGGTHFWHRAVVERARTVIVEVSHRLPHACGVEAGIRRDEVDYIIEGNDLAPAELPGAAPTAVDQAVGRLIAAEVESGSCLQIGIGGMPNAACSLLRDSGVRDLGIHTEMLTDGILDLYRAGLITGANKSTDKGKVAYTFLLGSASLYEAVHRNPDFHNCAVDYTNMPQTIMRNDRVVAINNTTQVDLQGQAASESDGHRHISGTGGQLQFVRAAYAAPNGKSFICLSSTYERRGSRKSRIVLGLSQGTIVTTPRSDMMYVVTEYGLVNLKGKSVADRAKALISIAHPDYREELERGARENNLIPRAYV